MDLTDPVSLNSLAHQISESISELVIELEIGSFPFAI